MDLVTPAPLILSPEKKTSNASAPANAMQTHETSTDETPKRKQTNYSMRSKMINKRIRFEIILDSTDDVDVRTKALVIFGKLLNLDLFRKLIRTKNTTRQSSPYSKKRMTFLKTKKNPDQVHCSSDAAPKIKEAPAPHQNLHATAIVYWDLRLVDLMDPIARWVSETQLQVLARSFHDDGLSNNEEQWRYVHHWLLLKTANACVWNQARELPQEVHKIVVE